MRLTLRINRRIEATLHKLEPGRLTVNLTAPDLADQERENRLLDMDLEELEESLKSGEVTPQEYAERRKELENAKKEAEESELGSDAEPWPRSIKLQARSPDSEEPKPLPFSLARSWPEEPVLKVNAEVNARADYSLKPADAEKIPEGGYIVKATLGEDESNEVLVSVSHAENLDPSEETVFIAARYHVLEGDAENALRFIDKLRRKDSYSLNVLILTGDVHQLRGEFKEARQSYEAALAEAEKRDPAAKEPPRIIQSRLALLPLEE